MTTHLDTWVIIVHWETLADSKASMEKFGKDPSVADFIDMIEPSSFKMSVFHQRH